MLHLIFYDISNSRARTKVAQKLTDLGYIRLQYSVFIGLDSPRKMPNLWKYMHQLITPDEDKIYTIQVSEAHFMGMDMLGKADWDMDYLSGNKDSVFF